jgi:hypothetical protein
MATLMLAAGIRVEVVSKRLGHARISVTYEMYPHPDDEQQREAAHTFGRLLADGREPDVGRSLANGPAGRPNANRPGPCRRRSGAVSRERRGRESNP